jgi:hypothetical protein
MNCDTIVVNMDFNGHPIERFLEKSFEVTKQRKLSSNFLYLMVTPAYTPSSLNDDSL